MRSSALGLSVALGLAPAGWAQSASPLSAIDWLSDTVAQPVAQPAPPPPDEPPAVSGAGVETITVRPLDTGPAATTGLARARARGLPDTLWAGAPVADLTAALARIRAPQLRSMQTLLRDLLIVSTSDGPEGEAGAELFYARVDALLAMGDVTRARALLDAAGREDPRNFRRWFDIAVLLGDENEGCAAMQRLPQITPTYAARIFCLARAGDWPAAIVTLETAQTLSVMTPIEAERMHYFLDETLEGSVPAPPRPVSPLDYAVYAAIGAPLPTASLPLAFAHADLRPMSGWKARIEAGERLARAGAIEPDRLWEIYGERMPAASGGVWERVEAVQKFDQAMRTGDPGAIAGQLPRTWEMLAPAQLQQVFAARYARAVNRLPLPGAAGRIAAGMAAMDDLSPRATPDPFLAALARGGDMAEAADSPLRAAIADGLGSSAPTQHHRTLVDEGRIGEAAIEAAALLDDAAGGNLDALRHGLSLLRAAGLEERARAAAIEIAILDPAT